MVIEETQKITKLSHSTMHSPCIDILDCQNFGISQNGDANFFLNEIYPQNTLYL